MNLTELEESYLQKHLDGMDRSAIRKELAQMDLSQEDQKTVLAYIDNSIMRGARSSGATIKLSNTTIYLGVFIIAFGAMAILTYFKSDGTIIAIPGILPLFIIVRMVSKRNLRKASRRSTRFNR